MICSGGSRYCLCRDGNADGPEQPACFCVVIVLGARANGQLICGEGSRMAKDKLSKYNGELSAAQIAHGMNAARRNARRLADDAKLLLNADRYPTAASIAALSIEESGKTSVLRGLASAPNEESRHRAWKFYRSHRSKNAAWILPELVAKGARDLDSLRLASNSSAPHTALLDQVKQIGLYTDEPFAKFGVGHEMGAECSCKITPSKGICTWLAMGFPLGARASRPHTCQGAAPASVGG